MFLVWVLLAGCVYPLLVTAGGQLLFHHQANGSLLHHNGSLIGSELIGQPFKTPEYFWPRPSATEYQTLPSGPSNYGPTSNKLKVAVEERRHFLGEQAPEDLLTASASGLDPHISPEAARFQLDRVSRARNLAPETVNLLIERLTEPPQWGILGKSRVNVLKLNIALDALSPNPNK